MAAFTTYALFDPVTGEMRYVGKTAQGVAVRMNEHRSCARMGKRTHLYCWIRSLAKSGYEPRCEVLGTYQTEREMNEAEVSLIAEYRGMARLVNHVGGGEGVSGWRHSNETRARISAAIRARPRKPLTDEQRRRVSASRGGKVLKDELGRVYQSASEAAIRLGINSGGVSRAARRPGYKVGGHSFSYVEA